MAPPAAADTVTDDVDVGEDVVGDTGFAFGCGVWTGVEFGCGVWTGFAFGCGVWLGIVGCCVGDLVGFGVGKGENLPSATGHNVGLFPIHRLVTPGVKLPGVQSLT